MTKVRKYRPSNGSEGEAFIGHYCEHCARDAGYRAGIADSCPIVAASLAYNIDDPKYPSEWQYVDGKPTCIAFESVKSTGEREG